MFSQKATIEAQWNAVMNHRRSERGILLSPHTTRCMLAGEIHEFITCTSSDRSIKIDDVAYLGFGLITSPGVIAVGDSVELGDRINFRVLGFDYTHIPNHINILLSADFCVSGMDLNLKVNQSFRVTGKVELDVAI